VVGGLFALGSGSLRRDLLNGFISTVLAAALMYPIDTMKTRVQVGKRPMTSKGVPGLYRGIAFSLARKCPENAAYIAIARYARQIILRHAHLENLALSNLAYWWMLAAACGTTLSISVIKVPLELLNKNLQTGQFSSAREALRRLFGSPGTLPLLGFSWLAIMIRDVPKAILQFTVTQALMRTHWLPALGMSAFWQNVLYSAVAAGLAAVLTTPFDVLGSRIMTQLRSQIRVRQGKLQWMGHSTIASEVNYEPLGPLDSLRNIVHQVLKERGWRGLWRGVWFRLAYYTPYCAVSFAIFQSLLNVEVTAPSPLSSPPEPLPDTS